MSFWSIESRLDFKEMLRRVWSVQTEVQPSGNESVGLGGRRGWEGSDKNPSAGKNAFPALGQIGLDRFN
jgi:hypothetical protein